MKNINWENCYSKKANFTLYHIAHLTENYIKLQFTMKKDVCEYGKKVYYI